MVMELWNNATIDLDWDECAAFRVAITESEELARWLAQKSQELYGHTFYYWCDKCALVITLSHWARDQLLVWSLGDWKVYIVRQVRIVYGGVVMEPKLDDIKGKVLALIQKRDAVASKKKPVELKGSTTAFNENAR